MTPDTHGKVTDKVHPPTDYEGPEWEQRYSSNLSLIAALDGGGWSTPRPSRFTLGTERPGAQRIERPQGRPGLVRKISPSPGLNIWTVPPVPTRCADYAIPLQWCQTSKSNLAWTLYTMTQCSLDPVWLVALPVRDQGME
jgi:hypothetical protein